MKQKAWFITPLFLMILCSLYILSCGMLALFHTSFGRGLLWLAVTTVLFVVGLYYFIKYIENKEAEGK